MLDEEKLTKQERMLVLAYTCYRSAKADARKQRATRKEFTRAFDEEYRQHLKKKYHPGQELLDAINGFGTWNEHRRLLAERNR